jgi:nitrogen regulatory protein P-II 1
MIFTCVSLYKFVIIIYMRNTFDFQEGFVMKMIIAIVRPEAVEDVKQALFKAEVHKMTVTHVKGCGQQLGYTETYRGSVTEVNLLNKVRFEICVNDEFVKPTIDSIVAAARTGNIGDGKIFVMPVEECIRIRTGEEGSEAIG